MKKLVFSLLAASIGSVVGLQASSFGTYNSCCDPCPSWCYGNFELGGQWVYLRPTACDYDFVIKDGRAFDPTDTDSIAAVSAELPLGESRGVNTDYGSGFRLSLGYIASDCSCYDIRAEYTYHHPRGRSKVFGGAVSCGLWPTYMHPSYASNFNVAEPVEFAGFETPLYSGIVVGVNNDELIQAEARSQINLNYDALDIQVGSRSMKGCNLWMRTYVGLHYMNLDHKQEAKYTGVFFGTEATPATAIPGFFDTHVKWTKSTWGIGPLFGIDARYDVACGFGIGGHIGAAILSGETDGKMIEQDTRTIQDTGGPVVVVDEPLNVKHDRRNLLFPYIRGSLGVNYLWCCSDCFKVVIEVGYEFNSYINSIGHFRFNDERGTGMANCYNYNLDGIYISVRGTI